LISWLKWLIYIIIKLYCKKYITEGEGLPKWSNPISHAVVVNNMCFVSGQLSVNLDGIYLPGTALEEGKITFSNFFAAIKNAGFDKSDIVFIDIAFDDLHDLPIINELFKELFPENKRPARTIYQAQALPFGGKVKITGTAVKDLA
jgi:2-iminobutanoate/2-iminopropanoate deaminase